MLEWRLVPDTNGMYSISIDTEEGKCFSKYKNRNLSEKPSNKDGRIRWCIIYKGKAISQQAAFWIAITYPELVTNEWFPGAEIDHIDTNPNNNHPSNLRWVTHKGNLNNENTIEKFKKSHEGILNSGPSKWVIKLSTNNEILHFYPSITQATRETGIGRTSISNCCCGLSETAGGFIWKYAN